MPRRTAGPVVGAVQTGRTALSRLESLSPIETRHLQDVQLKRIASLHRLVDVLNEHVCDTRPPLRRTNGRTATVDDQ